MNPITATAGVAAAPDLFAALFHSGLFHTLMALALGAILSPLGAKLADAVIDSSKNPLIHFGGHLFLGSVVATVMALFGQTFGVTPADAAAAMVPFMGVVHWLGALGLTTDAKADLVKVEAAAGSPAGIAALQAAATALGEPQLAVVIGAIATARQQSPAVVYGVDPAAGVDAAMLAKLNRLTTSVGAGSDTNKVQP